MQELAAAIASVEAFAQIASSAESSPSVTAMKSKWKEMRKG